MTDDDACRRAQDAIDAVCDGGLPTFDEIDQMREARDIGPRFMAELVGLPSTTWPSYQKRGSMPDARKRLALAVFDYYDDHGYIPTPDEVDEYL